MFSVLTTKILSNSSGSVTRLTLVQQLRIRIRICRLVDFNDHAVVVRSQA